MTDQELAERIIYFGCKVLQINCKNPNQQSRELFSKSVHKTLKDTMVGFHEVTNPKDIFTRQAAIDACTYHLDFIGELLQMGIDQELLNEDDSMYQIIESNTLKALIHSFEEDEIPVLKN